MMLQTLHKRAPNNYTKLFIKGLKRLRENSWEMMSDAEAGEGEPDDEWGRTIRWPTWWPMAHF
jgi:hypothetical protein